MIRFQRNNLLSLVLLFLGFILRTEAQTNDSTRAQYYNNLAVNSLNKYQFEKAQLYCDSALRIRENANSYYIQAHIDRVKHHWTDAIRHAERSMQFDSSYLPLYAVLFDAYYNAKKW